MDTELNPDSGAWIGRALLGGVVTANGAGTVVAREYYPAALPSLFIESSHSDISQHVLNNGCYAGAGAFNFEREGAIAPVRLSGMFTEQAIAGSSGVTGTITNRTARQVLSQTLIRIAVGGTTIAYGKAETLNINRGISEDFEQDETNKISGVFQGALTIDGTCTVNFKDTEHYDRSVLRDLVRFDIWIPDGSGYGVWVELPNTLFSPVGPDLSGNVATLSGPFACQDGTIPARCWSDFFTTPADLDTLTLLIDVDSGGDQTITFAASDNTPALVVTKINATLTGATAKVIRQAGETGGTVYIEHDTPGAGTLQINATSTADTVLGFDNVSHAGQAAVGVYMTCLTDLGAA